MSDDNLERRDLRLLRRAMNAQDNDALKALHTKYYSRTKHFVTSRVGSQADAEDIAQEVFLQIWKLDDGFEVKRTVEAYILGIAHRLMGDHFRGLKRGVKTVPLGSVGEIDDNHSQQPNGGRFENTSRLELKKLIRDAAAHLPHKSREAIVLRFIQGLPTREAAAKAGCSIPAFYRRVERAVRMLREIVQKNRRLEKR